MNQPRHRGGAVTKLLILLVLVAVAAALWAAVGAIGHAPVHISVHGEEILSGFDLSTMPTVEKALLVGGLMVALLTALIIVPVALLMALVGVLIAALSVVGLPLLVVLTLLAVLMSPVLLIAWLLWRALRPTPNIAA